MNDSNCVQRELFALIIKNEWFETRKKEGKQKSESDRCGVARRFVVVDTSAYLYRAVI